MMKVTLVLLNLMVFYTYAQTDQQLWNQFYNEKLADSVRLRSIHNLAYELVNKYPDSSYKVTQLELKLSLERKNKKYEAAAYNTLGILAYNKSNYEEAKRYYHKSMLIRMNIQNHLGVSMCLNNLGVIAMEESNFKSALDYYFKSIEITESLKNDPLTSSTLGNIGMVYDAMGEKLIALKYYMLSSKNTRNVPQPGAVWLNIGLIYNQLTDFEMDQLKIDNKKRLELAFFYLKKALHIHQENNDLYGLEQNYYGLGDFYLGMYKHVDTIDSRKLIEFLPASDLLDSSWCYFNKAKRISDDIDHEYGQMHSFIAYGKLYEIQENLVEAISSYKVAYAYAERLGAIAFKHEAGESLYHLYKVLKNDKLALLWLERSVEAERVVFGDKEIREIKAQELKYQFEKKQLKDSLYFQTEKEINERDIKLKGAENRILWISLTGLLFSSIGVFQFVKIRNRQKTKIIEIDLKNKKRDLHEAMTRIVEKRKEKEILLTELNQLKLVGMNESKLLNVGDLASSKILTKENWTEFKEKFTLIYPTFFIKLRNHEFDYTNAEERLLALEKLNLKTPEMASILGVSEESVSRIRYRLRKKLNISGDVKVVDFVESL